MQKGAISGDISLLTILALEGLWKGLLLSPCRRRRMEQALVLSPRLGGSQGICSIPHGAVGLYHLVEESCRTFLVPPGFCGS